MAKCPKCGLEMKLSKDGKWYYCPENSRDSEHKGFLKNIQAAQESTGVDLKHEEIMNALRKLYKLIKSGKKEKEPEEDIWEEPVKDIPVIEEEEGTLGINPDLAGEIERDAPEEKIPF